MSTCQVNTTAGDGYEIKHRAHLVSGGAGGYMGAPIDVVETGTGPVLGGAGPNWKQFRSAQIPSQLPPRSTELGVGPNWEQLVKLA